MRFFLRRQNRLFLPLPGRRGRSPFLPALLLIVLFFAALHLWISLTYVPWEEASTHSSLSSQSIYTAAGSSSQNPTTTTSTPQNFTSKATEAVVDCRSILRNLLVFNQNADSIEKSNHCMKQISQRWGKDCTEKILFFPRNNTTTVGSTRWNTLQSCLNRRFSTAKIRKVHIVGERNSGTKFLTQELQSCFPRDKEGGVTVHRDFVRPKHFFQSVPSMGYAESLVVSVFRDPVEWTAALREKPYHSPNHVQALKSDKIVPLPWRDFVSKQWSMKGSVHDNWSGSSAVDSGDDWLRICEMYNFTAKEMEPCLFDAQKIPSNRIRGFHPVYELQQQSGLPFPNVLDMRSDKILNFLLEVPLWTDIGGYYAVRYEDLLSNGTDFVIRDLSRLLDQKPSCSRSVPPQPERLSHRKIDPEFRLWINEHKNRDLEGLLDYV